MQWIWKGWIPFAQKIILALVSSLRKQILLSWPFVFTIMWNCLYLLKSETYFFKELLINMGVILIINDFCSYASCFLHMTLWGDWHIHTTSCNAFWPLLSEGFITYVISAFTFWLGVGFDKITLQLLWCWLWHLYTSL